MSTSIARTTLFGRIGGFFRRMQREAAWSPAELPDASAPDVSPPNAQESALMTPTEQTAAQDAKLTLGSSAASGNGAPSYDAFLSSESPYPMGLSDEEGYSALIANDDSALSTMRRGDSPLSQPANDAIAADQSETGEDRTVFLRPWVKRDQAIDQLQTGVNALANLMDTIRETMERSSERQDELLNYLSGVPAAIASVPESFRAQGEALKGIKIGIEQQNLQQGKLVNVLEAMQRTDARHQETLDAVRDRVDTIVIHEREISGSLSAVGSVLETVSNTSQASAKVLENLRDGLVDRDIELESIIRRQNTRFTAMLSVAIVLSMAALTAVVVFGYLGYETLSLMAK